MNKLFSKFIKNLAGRKNHGDTIIEVIISTAIIALALAGSYALSHHSLQTGVSATQRTAALELAQNQIEQIRNFYSSDTSPLKPYQNTGLSFCVLGSGQIQPTQSSYCIYYNGSPYSISVNYNGDTNTYTAAATWDSQTNEAIKDNLSLYYKPPYPAPPTSCTPGSPGCGPCTENCPAPADFSIKAKPPVIYIPQGGGDKEKVTVLPGTGFTSDVKLTFSCASCPTSDGDEGVFSGNPAPIRNNEAIFMNYDKDTVNPTKWSTGLNIFVGKTTPAINYMVTVTGTSGGISHSAEFMLVVQKAPEPPPPDPTCKTLPPDHPDYCGPCVYNPYEPWITCCDPCGCDEFGNPYICNYP